jgi:uncharacterized membrane protein
VPEKIFIRQILDAFEPRHFAKDLIFIAAWMIATVGCIYVPVLNQSFFRIIFGLLMILFIPGYVLIVTLFPGKDDLEGIERLALSFGLSIIIVPLIGLVLNFTPWGIRLDPIVISLVAFTAVIIFLAQYRRSILPPEQRFIVPIRETLESIRVEIYEHRQSRNEKILSIILILAIIAAVGTFIYVIAVPTEGEKFTEFYILGPGGTANDYPTRFTVGQEQTLIIGIGNHEYRNVTYTVETILLHETFDPTTNTSIISAYQPLDSFTALLVHNETKEFPYHFTVNDQGYNRLQFLLFNETVPAADITGSARVDTSYRDLHLWIMVEPRNAS